MRRVQQSSDIPGDSPRRQPSSWLNSVHILLATIVVAFVSAASFAIVSELLLTRDIENIAIVEPVVFAMMVTALTVLPSIFLFVIVNRYWPRPTAQLICLGVLWASLSVCVAGELYPSEVSGIGWFMSEVTVASGAAAFATLTWMTRPEVEIAPIWDEGTPHDQP